MARKEMNFRPASGGRPTYVDGTGQAPSTFRDSVGEVWVRRLLFPREWFPGLFQQIRDTVSVWRPRRDA